MKWFLKATGDLITLFASAVLALLAIVGVVLGVIWLVQYSLLLTAFIVFAIIMFYVERHNSQYD